MKLVIDTFGEFHNVVKRFGEGHFDLLIVVGSPGLSKTRSMKAACPDARIIQGGNLTAFGFYLQLYEHRDQTIIADDIDQLYTNKDAIRLLKAVCQTEPVKTVGWHTASRSLPMDLHGNHVHEFSTRSRIAIIANEWKTLNKNVAAVGDRGLLVAFEPSAQEVHRQVKTWFKDEEIIAFVAKHLDIIASPSMRTYVMAQQLKTADLDWKAALLTNWNQPIPIDQAIVKLDRLTIPVKEKEVLYSRWTGQSRASYYNHKKKQKKVLTTAQTAV